MDISIQHTQNELLPLSKKSDLLYRRLMREKNCLSHTLEKERRQFCDQEAGRAIISELTQAIREVQYAFNELEQLKGEIIEFTDALTK